MVYPVVLGFIAGVTVLLGALFMMIIGGRFSGVKIGFLNGVAGGVLAYLALEAGHEASEYVESLASFDKLSDFIVAFLVTSIALIGTWILLAYTERSLARTRVSGAMLTATIVAIALGLHNVGEGFAIAGPFLVGGRGNSVLNVNMVTIILALSLIAGLPVITGALVYYTGVSAELALSVLYTIATASIVYAMLHINLVALGKLGGVSSPLFWTSIFTGVAVTYTVETIVLFTMA